MAPPQKLGQNYYELELVGLGKSRLQHISGCVSISESVSQLATHTFQIPTLFAYPLHNGDIDPYESQCDLV